MDFGFKVFFKLSLTAQDKRFVGSSCRRTEPTILHGIQFLPVSFSLRRPLSLLAPQAYKAVPLNAEPSTPELIRNCKSSNPKTQERVQKGRLMVEEDVAS